MIVSRPYIPEYITVHLGAPKENAQNVTIAFSDYIKNVASSEIYPTWELPALRSNIYAQISYALNRIYVEYYRSRGYNFDITNSTSIDQKFINGRNIFDNIDKLVGEIFATYIRRVGNIEPLAAKYCNGTTTTCDGLSQWGSQSLAQEGYNSIDILKYYYGDDVELVINAPIRGITESYPGTPLRLESTGQGVQLIQFALNRISQNYPLIPKIAVVDGIFDEGTERSVKTFQGIFNLTADGIVGRATWYKIIFLYVGITNLSELNSEGQKIFNASLEYPDAISLGNTGEKVEILQYFLAVISDFYLTIPPIAITGYFGKETENAVISFQQEFNLPETGIVDKDTWNLIYNSFKGIADTVFIDDEIFSINTLPYGGTVLKYGSKGEDVKALQGYLNTISIVFTQIIPVAPLGIFDKETEAAVMEYQEQFDIPITGIVDQSVWNSISNTYKDVVSAGTSRPKQYPGKVLKLNDKDSTGGQV